MLLKSADEKSHFVTSLQNILAHPELARERKPFVEKEIRGLQAQIESQMLSSHAIDGHVESSDYIAVLHDLRLPHNGRTVTVDHLLISLSLDVVVLSTQLFSSSLRISSRGYFERVSAGRTTAVRNPLEEAQKALDAVKEACRAVSWPTRLGVQLLPEFRHAVLFHSNATIVRDAPTVHPNIQCVDDFMLEFVRAKASLKQGLVSLARGVSTRTLEQVGEQLLSLHRPLTDDFAARFGVRGAVEPKAIPTPTPPASRAPANARPGASGPVADSGARLSRSLDEVKPVPALDESLKRPHAGTRVAASPARMAERALERAVAAGALTPRRTTPERTDRRPTPSLLETRVPGTPLKVPDQPDSFRKDTSLHAELLRPRGSGASPRPRTEELSSPESQPEVLRAVPTVTHSSGSSSAMDASARALPEPDEPVEPDFAVPGLSLEPSAVPVIAETPPDAIGTAPGADSAVATVEIIRSMAEAPVASPLEHQAQAQAQAQARLDPHAEVAPGVPSPPASPALPERVVASSAASASPVAKSAGYYCKDCAVEVSATVARFCWQNKHRFGGRVYCGSCQEKHPNPSFPRREPRTLQGAT